MYSSIPKNILVVSMKGSYNILNFGSQELFVGVEIVEIYEGTKEIEKITIAREILGRI